MAKTKNPPNEDPAQSKRFIEVAEKMEAAGELDHTEAATRFERTLRAAAPPKRRPPQDDQP